MRRLCRESGTHVDRRYDRRDSTDLQPRSRPYRVVRRSCRASAAPGVQVPVAVASVALTVPLPDPTMRALPCASTSTTADVSVCHATESLGIGTVPPSTRTPVTESCMVSPMAVIIVSVGEIDRLPMPFTTRRSRQSRRRSNGRARSSRPSRLPVTMTSMRRCRTQ